LEILETGGEPSEPEPIRGTPDIRILEGADVTDAIDAIQSQPRVVQIFGENGRAARRAVVRLTSTMALDTNYGPTSPPPRMMKRCSQLRPVRVEDAPGQKPPLPIVNVRSKPRAGALLPLANNPIAREWYVMHAKGRQVPRVAAAFEEFLTARAQAEIDRHLGRY